MEKKKKYVNERYIKGKDSSWYNKPLLTEKPKSLKDLHFANFFNNVIQNIPKINYYNTPSLTETSINTMIYLDKSQSSYKQKLLSLAKENPVIIERNFKNPKDINYKLLKFNPVKSHFKPNLIPLSEIKNNNLEKRENKYYSEKIIRDNKSIAFYNIKFNKDKKVKKDNEENNKKFNKNKKNIFIKEEYDKLVNKIKSHNDIDKNKKNKFRKYYENNVREGFFGQKDTYGIPYFYDTSSIFNNEYSTKSEKKRHEFLQNELNKLKTYLIRHPDKKLLLIKDFLQKFHIDQIEKYTDKQLLNLCNFISNIDANAISNILKPYLNIKNMLYDILNNIIDFTNIPREEKYIEDKGNDINNNYNSSKEFYSSNYSTNNFCPKNESPIKQMIQREYYLSPLIIPSRTNLSKSMKMRKASNNKSEILINKNLGNNDNNFKAKSHIFDLNLTNSNLKYLKYQSKTFKPEINYSNSNIVLNEIGKEIKDIENDYHEKLKELELRKNSENKNGKKYMNFTLHKPKSFNIETKDRLYINIKNKNNTRLKMFVPVHYNLTKNFYGKMQNLDEVIKQKDNKLLNSENNLYRERKMTPMDNFCLNSTERNYKYNNNILTTGNSNFLDKHRSESFDRVKNPKINDIEIVKRLYYNPTRKKFGLQEIKKRLKLTEYIALTHAKKNIYKNEVRKIVDMQK